ncbi:hypothetical protein [uncultured Umboniibacter sp.]|uniref:endonuclease/exonuclease/phosphatase family protein n=1 Tax=uncultured Umboniibacter sp. TaxID=1798917 RepID=UPI00262FD597|nr:hypothetical protein [uncultured Umboniibacter sp.]
MGVIGSWKVDGADFCPRQLALIAIQKIDVLTLQGASRRFYSALKASGHFAHSCYQEGGNQGGTAIFSHYLLGEYYLCPPTLKRHPLIRYVALPTGMVAVGSLCLDEVDDLNLAALEQLSGPVVLAVSSVETDLDLTSLEYQCTKGSLSEWLLQGDHLEGLSDAYLRYIRSQSFLRTSIQNGRDDYNLIPCSRGRPGGLHPFSEHLLVNKHLAVKWCRYKFLDACEVGVYRSLICLHTLPPEIAVLLEQRERERDKGVVLA